MTTYTNIFVRAADKITCKSSGSGGILIKIDDKDGPGGDATLFFESIADAERLADAIFHYKMDNDAEYIQDEESKSSGSEPITADVPCALDVIEDAKPVDLAD